MRSLFRDTMCTYSAGTQEKHGEVVEMLIEGKKKSYNKITTKGKMFQQKIAKQHHREFYWQHP